LNRTLITGATGFVGRAVCESFLSRGITVRAAARRDADPAFPQIGTGERFITGDMTDKTDWRGALAGCDAVVHLAARAHVMNETAADLLSVYRAVNTHGALNLARQAVDAGVKRFIFASTVKVNGEGRCEPYRESECPMPQDAYAISKWEAEQGLRELADRTGLELVILRFPLVYGPGVSANFLRMIRTVDNGIPLPFGHIQNRRSLIYLGNLVDAIAACLTHPQAANKTFLVSDGEDVSTPELIRRLAKALDRPGRLPAVPVRWLRWAGMLAGKRKEVDRLLGSLSVDSSLIRGELGWSPPFSMEDGLAETAKWYRARYGRGS
jgi:nucleoside-diphosphate-sugar epimerase